jgi:polar amino acid transport system substrate-binding protein
VLALVLAVPARAETIILASDYWCPYICDPVTTGRAGISIDVAVRVFKEAGHTISFVPVNWKRAISETRNGAFDAIVDATREDAPDFIFPAEPLNEQQSCFFTNASSHWNYEGIASLADVSLGVVAGYHYTGELDEYINQNAENRLVAVMHGDDALVRNVQRMRRGMIDVLAEDPLVLEWLLRSGGRSAALRKAGCMAERTALFIAFSPINKHAAEYARILSEGIRRLRASGDLDVIRKQYGIE